MYGEDKETLSSPSGHVKRARRGHDEGKTGKIQFHDWASGLKPIRRPIHHLHGRRTVSNDGGWF